jgi:hypothetical protein
MVRGTYSVENGHDRARLDLCEELDRYVPGFRETEELGHGLAIGYELERILADEGGLLRITESHSIKSTLTPLLSRLVRKIQNQHRNFLRNNQALGRKEGECEKTRGNIDT